MGAFLGFPEFKAGAAHNHFVTMVDKRFYYILEV